MPFPIRFSAPILLAAALGAPLAVTGCQQQPAPAATSSSNDASYRQWERETHRQHQDLNQRKPEENKEYNDWRTSHEHH